MSARLSSQQWARVAAILDEVVEQPAAERAARVAALSSGDEAVRAAVEAVLRHDVPDDRPFHAAVDEALNAAEAATAATQPGQRIGPYRLIREIGRGGMGAVYLAARDDAEFEQQVAIKVVGGLLGPHLLRRFLAERQILASLTHPNIARLLDGGTTNDGLPYLVMEHVDGVPIDQYCRERRLALRDRLALMLQVCDAVAYAHRSLVVHRDLKPTNILVTAGGVPKLLDFGIAKLLDDTADSPAPQTLTAEQLLTPEYASPEQIRGERITTASDVYALGVMLYEVLTGERPYRFRTRRPDEMARVICDDPVGRPSTVLARASAPQAAADRIAVRPRDLAGDLDTIVLTAMEKEAVRRYPSVDALADDVRRHLAGEPVRARPATLAYRGRLFVRRHRLAIAAAAAAIVLLTGWGITAVINSRRVARERDTALQVTTFLVDLFASSDPNETRSADITARELLDRGTAKLEGLKEQPEIKARLLDAIAKVYRSIGAADRAAPLLRESLQLRQAEGGRETVDTSATSNELAEALRELGQYADAEPIYRQALAARERLLGPSHASVAQSRNNLGLLLRARGKSAEAEPLFRQAVAGWRASLGAQHPQVAVGLANLALVERDRSNYDEAERLVREALAIRRAAFGDTHPSIANSLMALGQTLNAAGRYQAAEPLMLEALEMRRTIYGDDHPLVDGSLNNLASLRQDLGDLAGAEPLYRTALEHERRRLGRHVDVAVTMNNLASLLEERGALQDAEALYRESLGIRRERLGPKHASVARSMHNLARLLRRERRLGEAEAIAREALAMRTAALGASHVETAQSMALVGDIRAASGDRRGGEALLRQALEIERKKLAANHPTIQATSFDLALVLLDQGRAAEAEPLLRGVAAARAARLPEGHWLRAYTDVMLGRALRDAGRRDEARPLIEAGTRVLAAALPPGDERLRAAVALR